MADPTRPTTLGEVLRAARVRAGMTQEQLAGLSTVSVRAIRDLEQGRVAGPRRDTIRLLADAMRLGEAARATLESAIESASADRVLLRVSADEVAPPPVPVRPLHGRRDVLGPLTELLGSRQPRLLTLTGLPGVGKSRLAQELAALVHARYGTPVLWVELDRAGRDMRHDPSSVPGRDREAVAALVASALVHGGDHAALAALIGHGPALLVLDGYEPTAAGADRLGDLLTACEGLTVLATGRRAEPMADGAQIPVTGLVSGGASAAGDDTAVGLMLSFARCRCPGLPLSAETRAQVALICHALDGLPRALREAADWLLLLSPEQVAEIALHDPLELVGEALAGGLEAALPVPGSPLEDALVRLATMPGRWSLDTAAEALSLSAGETARAVRALVLLGLVRRTSTSSAHDAGRGPETFEVLNLVRHAVAGRHGTALPLQRASRPVSVVA